MTAQLLRQPGGFEGLVVVSECLATDEPPVPNGPHVPQVPGCCSAALPATAPKGQGYEHMVTRVSQVIEINVRILELVLDPADDGL